MKMKKKQMQHQRVDFKVNEIYYIIIENKVMTSKKQNDQIMRNFDIHCDP